MAKEIVTDLWGQRVSLIKEDTSIQFQVENNGEECYVDLSMPEVKKLKESLEIWINEKEASNG